MGFISLVNEIQFMLISSGHILNRSICTVIITFGHYSQQLRLACVFPWWVNRNFCQQAPGILFQFHIWHHMVTSLPNLPSHFFQSKTSEEISEYREEDRTRLVLCRTLCIIHSMRKEYCTSGTNNQPEDYQVQYSTVQILMLCFKNFWSIKFWRQIWRPLLALSCGTTFITMD